MSTETGWRHINFILNGIRVDGYANEDPPVEFSNINFIERTRGKDGTAHDLATGIKGSEVMIKLQSTSRFTGQCLRWAAQMLNDEVVPIEGSYSDERLGISATLRGGKMTECPPMITPGETFEATFDFEEIIPNADGANFDSPPGNLV